MQQGQGAEEAKSVNHPVLQALADTREGRASLNALLDPLFVDLWKDFLNIVFEWFPHQPGDCSANARSFTAVRHRVLRGGNEAKREMSKILEDFAITQLRVREVQVVWRAKGHGPFNLPTGVKLREPKRG